VKALGSPISQVRVYTSFDVDHDKDLKAKLLREAAQSGSGFEIQGCSEAAELTDSWSEGVRSRIAAADEVIVVCGEHTHDSRQVAAEIGIAQAERKPYFLLWGRRGVMCTKPVGARPDEGMYSWTTSILRDQIALTLRVARSLAESDRHKRPRAAVPAPSPGSPPGSRTAAGGSGSAA
jgi:hypothetical protein